MQKCALQIKYQLLSLMCSNDIFCQYIALLPTDYIFLTWVIMFNAEERNPNTDSSEIVWDKRSWWNRSWDSCQAPRRFWTSNDIIANLPIEMETGVSISRTHVIFDYYYLFLRLYSTISFLDTVVQLAKWKMTRNVLNPVIISNPYIF